MGGTSGDRRRFLAAGGRGLLAASLAGCGRRHAAVPRRPRPRNLVLISIDTLRADHMGCYGYPRRTTPRLDALARNARFVNCTSPSSWTVPAHLSIFTSLEPATHQCVYYAKPGRLNDGYETMAKIFMGNGFRTGAFTGGGFAGARHGLDIGFERFATRGRRFEQNLCCALDWLDDVGRERFLLFFHGFDAHRPYASRSRYRQRFKNGYQGNYPILQFGPRQPRPNPEDLRFVVSQYDGEIAMVDDLLAYFFKQLQRRNLLDTTLVVVLSDHGEEFYEHGSCDHIRTLYDELVRVPWIMWGPGVPSVEIDSHVGTIDVLPTVLPLFGLEANVPMQGTDRSGLLTAGDAKQDAAVYSFTGKGNPPYHLFRVRTVGN